MNDRSFEININDVMYEDRKYSVTIFHSSNQSSCWDLSLGELRRLQQAIQEELDAADV